MKALLQKPFSSAEIILGAKNFFDHTTEEGLSRGRPIFGSGETTTLERFQAYDQRGALRGVEAAHAESGTTDGTARLNGVPISHRVDCDQAS